MMIVRRSDNVPVFGPDGKTSLVNTVSVDGCELIFTDEQVNSVSVGRSAYIGEAFGISCNYIDVDANL